MLWTALAVLLVLVVTYDLTQRRHAILRNFPLIGHLRYLLESVGPELRQYIVTSNDEERPFSRDERAWIYTSAKRLDNTFGFGTDNPVETAASYLIVKHAAFPHGDPPGGLAAFDDAHRLPCGKVFGAARRRPHAFRPASLVHVSAMSYGSLSGAAVTALNRGARAGGCLHNTGEGGVAEFHRQGGELIWQIGTGYFGCRDDRGRFDLARLLEELQRSPVRALEIKLSQGAKPGKGGILPAAKVTPAIAAIRGVPVGRDCISPSRHDEFRDADELLDFVERLAEASGLPVGIKSAVGESAFWEQLAALMVRGDRGVDFITVDGGEGGTGAAPPVFADHVALPFLRGFSRVHGIFHEAELAEQVVFVGSGRLGLPQRALLALALGCDQLAVAREAMLAVGCIQAQRCHTGRCPTGVATQSRWLERGLDPDDKTDRVAAYVGALRRELHALAHACGVAHPALVSSEQIEVLDGRFGSATAREVFGQRPGQGQPGPARAAELEALMAAAAAASRPCADGVAFRLPEAAPAPSR